MEAQPVFAFTPARRKQDSTMGCCAGQLADELQRLEPNESTKFAQDPHKKEEAPEAVPADASGLYAGAGEGYGSSPPQPQLLVPGEAEPTLKVAASDVGAENQTQQEKASSAATAPVEEEVEVHNDLSWLEAAAAGETATLMWHLGQAADSNKCLEDCAEDRRTALHMAAFGGHLSACAWLLRAAADPAAMTKTKATPLHLAAQGGHLDVVKLLLQPEAFDIEQGESWPNALSTDLWRCTPLHRAAETGAEEVARLLLQQRAAADKADREGNTPLHKAANLGSGPLLRLLTQQSKVQLDFANNDGFSPLDICVREKHAVAGEVLVSAGAKLVKDIRKHPPTLHAAASSGLPFLCSYVLNGDQRLIKKQIAELDGSGRSPLLVAASLGHTAVVARLLEIPCCREQLESITRCGVTALHAAAFAGHRDVLELLLERSANLQLPDGNGISALGHAARAGHVELMRWLLERGLEPDARNDSERTALHFAAAAGQVSACEVLLDVAEESSALLEAQDWEGATAAHMAIRGGHAAVCRLLATHRADLQADLDFGVTPLQIAADSGHQEVLLLLLEDLAGDAHPDALHKALTKGRVSDGRTPWLLAAAEGHRQGCESIWCASKACLGMDLPLSHDRAGRTAMILAAKGGHVDVCVWLTESGCCPGGLHERDACGWTPLHAASAEGHKPMVEWLLSQGADLLSVDEDGRTARNWAELRQHGAIESVLRRAEKDASAAAHA